MSGCRAARHQAVAQQAVFAHREAVAGRQRQHELVGVEGLHGFDPLWAEAARVVTGCFGVHAKDVFLHTFERRFTA
jgi:hypothetical protein